MISKRAGGAISSLLTAPVLILVVAATFRASAGIDLNSKLNLKIIDDPAHQRFTLVLENDNHRAVCISDALWPNKSGIIAETSAQIEVEVDGRTYPIDTFIEDWSTEMYRLKGHGSLTAHLRYDAFNLPEDTYSHNKTLRLVPRVALCS